MCALLGYINYGGSVSNKNLKKLIRSLFIQSEVRGRDASGVAFVKGGEMQIHKAPVPGRKFHCNIPADTKVVMGHVRMTTQGPAANNENNHPWSGKTGDTCFALAHNGVIFNELSLKMSKNLPYTSIETDSYVAVQLLEQKGDLGFMELKELGENVHGTFTFTVLDDKNNLYFVKGDSPLFIAHYEALKIYIYSSTEGIFHKVIAHTNLRHEPFKKIEALNGDIIKIDAEGKIERSTFKTLCSYFLNPRWSFGLNYREPEPLKSSNIDELKDLGTLFGVTSEEINALLDLGFSVNDITDLLEDPDLLREQLLELQEEPDYVFEY